MTSRRLRAQCSVGGEGGLVAHELYEEESFMPTNTGCHILAVLLPIALNAQVTALRVGHLVDPENGTVAHSRVILVENGRFTAIGANPAIPAGTEVVDMSQYWVTPGLVDAHNHLALTY